ncbi:MAG: hypothetical protein Q9174_001750 [Haloplaca sp. 1 TL-2023]
MQTSVTLSLSSNTVGKSPTVRSAANQENVTWVSLLRDPDTVVLNDNADERDAEPKRCWQAPDGQVQCEPGKNKRVIDERDAEPEADAKRCWQAPDGQVQCEPGKRDGMPKRCWQAPDGQVQCEPGKEKRDIDERSAEPKRCWQAPDGQVQCEPGKEKREADGEDLPDLPPPGPVANGTSKHCSLWWQCFKDPGTRDPCLSALIAGQNITFATFRKLNPSVDVTCSNLMDGSSYCIKGLSGGNSTASPSMSNMTFVSTPTPSPELIPAVRATQARSGTRHVTVPYPTARPIAPQAMSAEAAWSASAASVSMTGGTPAALTTDITLGGPALLSQLYSPPTLQSNATQTNKQTMAEYAHVSVPPKTFATATEVPSHEGSNAAVSGAHDDNRSSRLSNWAAVTKGPSHEGSNTGVIADNDDNRPPS